MVAEDRRGQRRGELRDDLVVVRRREPGIAARIPEVEVAGADAVGEPRALRHVERQVIARELARKTSRGIELRSLNPAQADRTLAVEDFLWIARIMWASQ